MEARQRWSFLRASLEVDHCLHTAEELSSKSPFHAMKFFSIDHFLKKSSFPFFLGVMVDMKGGIVWSPTFFTMPGVMN